MRNGRVLIINNAWSLNMTQYEAPNPLYDGEEVESAINKNRLYKAALVGTGILGLVSLSYFAIKNIEAKNEEIKSSKLEGLLRGRGFDQDAITIDVIDGAKKLVVSCEPAGVSHKNVNPKSIELFLKNDTAFLKLDPLVDANGQQLGDDQISEFPLQTTEQINHFVDGFLNTSCDYLSK